MNKHMSNHINNFFCVEKLFDFNKYASKKLDITQLYKKEVIQDPIWNATKRGEIIYDYMYRDKRAGWIIYLKSGQIISIYVEDEFRNFGIGKKMTYDAIIDLHKHNVNKIWCIADINHTFWSNVFDKSFVKTKNGFCFEIKN